MALTVEERHAPKIGELVASGPPTPGGGSSSSTGIPVLILFLDSGATRHMVGDPGILCNIRDLPAASSIMLADGSRRLTATKIGDIETEHIKIKDVCLVPGLKMDVVSVRQLTKSNMTITFRENDVELWKEGERVGGAIAVGELYQLRYLTATGDWSYTSPGAASGSYPCAASVVTGDYTSGKATKPVFVHGAEDLELCQWGKGKDLYFRDREWGKGKYFDLSEWVPETYFDFEDSFLMCDKWYAVDLPPLTDKLDVSVETGGGACCINKATDGSVLVLGKGHLGSDVLGKVGTE